MKPGRDVPPSRLLVRGGVKGWKLEGRRVNDRGELRPDNRVVLSVDLPALDTYIREPASVRPLHLWLLSFCRLFSGPYMLQDSGLHSVL